MKTFILILTIWHSDGPPDVYVIDHDLTGTDCIYALETLDGVFVHGSELSCRLGGGES